MTLILIIIAAVIIVALIVVRAKSSSKLSYEESTDQAMQRWLKSWHKDITYADLMPISDDEYDNLLNELKTKVNEQIGDEPDRVGEMQLPNIYAWTEIIQSMESRKREAYYVNNKSCSNCGGNHTILFHYKSNEDSLKELCGREGYMHICPHCLKILKLYNYRVS